MPSDDAITGELSPVFTQPPVVEVVCGLQFPPISDWLTSHYGLYWGRVKERYTRCEDHPPLGKLKHDESDHPEIVEIGILPPLRRVFLIDKSDNYLLQIQPSRFLHNWRKVKPTDDYPRFGAAYRRFLNNGQISTISCA